MRDFAWLPFSLLALSACGSGGADLADDPTDLSQTRVAQGQQVANIFCSVCHATGAADQSRNPDAPPLRTLESRAPGVLGSDVFPRRLRAGHPAQPDFGFTHDQADALITYLRMIQTSE